MKYAVYFAAAIVVLAFVGAGIYLVMHDHPWFGLLAFILGGSVKAEAD